MTNEIATMTSPETLILSQQAQAALALHPGSRIEVTIEGGKVTLRPMESDGPTDAIMAEES